MARQHQDPVGVTEINDVKTSGCWWSEFLQPQATVGMWATVRREVGLGGCQQFVKAREWQPEGLSPFSLKELLAVD